MKKAEQEQPKKQGQPKEQGKVVDMNAHGENAMSEADKKAALKKHLWNYMDIITKLYGSNKFSIHDLNRDTNCGIENAKGIINFMHTSGLIRKVRNEYKFINITTQPDVDIQKIMAQVQANHAQHIENVFVAELGIELVEESIIEAQKEYEKNKKNQENVETTEESESGRKV